ncbi:hypothetical protein [Streptomyces sp. NPDC048385]|uniref:hypothetical protein n=1 Tax=unclassified Streptomyces TaxID=2593676 RepID=UPI0034462B72
MRRFSGVRVAAFAAVVLGTCLTAAPVAQAHDRQPPLGTENCHRCRAGCGRRALGLRVVASSGADARQHLLGRMPQPTIMKMKEDLVEVKIYALIH